MAESWILNEQQAEILFNIMFQLYSSGHHNPCVAFSYG